MPRLRGRTRLESRASLPCLGHAQLNRPSSPTSRLPFASLEAVEEVQQGRETEYLCSTLHAFVEGDEFSVEVFEAARMYIENAERVKRNIGKVDSVATAASAIARTSSIIATTIIDKIDTFAHGESTDKLFAEALTREGDHTSWRRRLFFFVEYPQSSFWGKLFFCFVTLMVAFSCSCVVAETLPRYNPTVDPSIGHTWRTIEWVVTGFFVFESALRIIASVLDDRVPSSKTQNLIRYLRNPGNVMDLLALVPTIFEAAFYGTGMVVEGVLRTVRLLRLTKFLRRARPVQWLFVAIKRSASGLLAPLVFMLVTLVLLSTLLFFLERGDFDERTGRYTVEDSRCLSTVVAKCPDRESQFTSLAQSVWFALVTMSTVGFGDFVPLTPWGKAVAAIMMIVGVLLIAMPIAVIGAYYTAVVGERTEEIARRTEEEALLKDARFQEQNVRMESRVTTPAESLFGTICGVLNVESIDLANPGDPLLYVTDAAIEAVVRQLCNAMCNNRSLPPLFAAESAAVAPTHRSTKMHLSLRQQEHPTPVGAIPLWTAAVRSSACISGTVLLTRPLVLTVGASANHWSCAAPDVVVCSEELMAAEMATEEVPSVSQCHAVICVTRVWGDSVTLIRNVNRNEVKVNGKRIDSRLFGQSSTLVSYASGPVNKNVLGPFRKTSPAARDAASASAADAAVAAAANESPYCEWKATAEREVVHSALSEGDVIELGVSAANPLQYVYHEAS